MLTIPPIITMAGIPMLIGAVVVCWLIVKVLGLDDE